MGKGRMAVLLRLLVSGNTRSCGCRTGELRSITRQNGRVRARRVLAAPWPLRSEGPATPRNDSGGPVPLEQTKCACTRMDVVREWQQRFLRQLGLLDAETRHLPSLSRQAAQTRIALRTSFLAAAAGGGRP